jgi:cobalamin synthase
MRRVVYLPLVGIIVGCIAGLVFVGVDALVDSKGLAIVVGIAASLILTGAFLEKATVASIIGLFIKYQSLLLLPSRSIPFILVAAHAFSRFASGSLTLSANRAITARNSIIMASLGMLPLLLVGSMLFLFLVPLLWVVRALMAAWLSSKEGGLDGNRLLHTQHVVEVSFYVLVVVAYKFAFDLTAD